MAKILFNSKDDISFAVSKIIKKAVITASVGTCLFGLSVNDAKANPIGNAPQCLINAQHWTSTSPNLCVGRVRIANQQESYAGSSAHHTVPLTFGEGSDGVWCTGTYMGAYYIGRPINKPITCNGTANNGRWAFVVNHDGVVCINISDPFANGLCTLQGTANDIRLRVGGGILANTTYYGSDRRFKTEIEPINNLQNLFKLNSVQYKSSSEATRKQFENFKSEHKDLMVKEEFNNMVRGYEKKIAELDADTSLHFGFIAQDLLEIFPNLVIEDLGYLAVNYTGLIPVLVEVAKEQQKTNEAQQQQIKELQRQVEHLLAREKGKGIGTDALFNDAMLYQNNPNPFSEQTEIKFYIPDQSRNAFISIYDMNGREIMKLDIADRGNASVILNGRQLQAGMYLYSLIVDGKEIDTKRMILTNN